MDNGSQNHIKPTFIIIGATGGIGSELSRLLALSSSNLLLCSTNTEKLEILAEELEVDSYRLDATDFKQMDECINYAIDTYGQIDGVTNCVGSILLKPSHLISEEEWDQTISMNLKTSFAAIRSSSRAMMRSGGGSIVLVSSAAAITRLANHEAIAAAKSGVIGLVLSAAASYSRYGIRVNCVAPGLIRTPLTKGLTENEAILKQSTKMHPLGGIGEPQDVASAIAWFLQPEHNWVTGHVLGVDGGLANIKSR